MAKEKSVKKGAAASRLPSLAAKRAKIDRIDQELIKLMNQRAGVAHEIGQLKTDAGITAYCPAREEEVLARIVDLNKGPLDPRAACGRSFAS